MAVKPALGEVVVQTTRTQIEPAPNSKENSRESLLPIWDFVESMDAAYFNRCEFTIYRGRASQKAEDKTWIGKFCEKISPDIIQRRWGGGEYNVWLKVPIGDSDKLQLKYNVDLKIEGSPKAFTEQGVSTSPTSTTEIGQILAMMREDRQMFMSAIRELSGAGSSQKAVEQALALNGQVFGAAMPAVVSTLQRVNEPHANNGSSGMDDLTKQFLQAAITKMLNPADPIESFSKMATAMSSLGFKMGGNANGGIAAELARGLMGALPQLAAHVGGIMDQYRRAEEAKLHHAALIRGQAPPIVVQPSPVPQPAPATNVIEMPAAPAENGTGAPMSTEQSSAAEQLFQYVETKVVELLLNLDLTPEEAANDALTFIDVTDKNLTDELLRHGEGGLRWAFGNRPTLRQVPQGPRLEAFIAEFVKNGRKIAVPIPLAPDPSIPPA